MPLKTKYIISTASGFDFECNTMHDADKELIEHSKRFPQVQMAIWKLVKTKTTRKSRRNENV